MRTATMGKHEVIRNKIIGLQMDDGLFSCLNRHGSMEMFRTWRHFDISYMILVHYLIIGLL